MAAPVPQRKYPASFQDTDHFQTARDIWASPVHDQHLTTPSFSALSHSERSSKRRKIETLVEHVINGKEVYIASSRANGLSLQELVQSYTASERHSRRPISKRASTINRQQPNHGSKGQPFNKPVRKHNEDPIADNNVSLLKSKEQEQVTPHIRQRQRRLEKPSVQRTVDDTVVKTNKEAETTIQRTHENDSTKNKPASHQVRVGCRAEDANGEEQDESYTLRGMRCTSGDCRDGKEKESERGSSEHATSNATSKCTDVGIVVPVQNVFGGIKDAGNLKPSSKHVSSPFQFQRRSRVKACSQALKTSDVPKRTRSEHMPLDSPAAASQAAGTFAADVESPQQHVRDGSEEPALQAVELANLAAVFSASPIKSPSIVTPSRSAPHDSRPTSSHEQSMLDTQALIDEAQKALFDTQLTHANFTDLPSDMIPSNTDQELPHERGSDAGATSSPIPGPPSSSSKPLPATQALLDGWSPWSIPRQTIRDSKKAQVIPIGQRSKRRSTARHTANKGDARRSSLRFAVTKPGSSANSGTPTVSDDDKVRLSSAQAAQQISPSILNMEASMDRTIVDFHRI